MQTHVATGRLSPDTGRAGGVAKFLNSKSVWMVINYPKAPAVLVEHVDITSILPIPFANANIPQICRIFWNFAEFSSIFHKFVEFSEFVEFSSILLKISQFCGIFVKIHAIFQLWDTQLITPQACMCRVRGEMIKLPD